VNEFLVFLLQLPIECISPHTNSQDNGVWVCWEGNCIDMFICVFMNPDSFFSPWLWFRNLIHGASFDFKTRLIWTPNAASMPESPIKLAGLRFHRLNAPTLVSPFYNRITPSCRFLDLSHCILILFLLSIFPQE